MPYHELKPSQAATTAGGIAKLDYTKFGGAPPREIIEFGFIPDLERMKPGDIVLVRPEVAPAKPTQPIRHVKSVLHGDASYYIQTAQKKLQSPPHHRWVHAGLYLGRDLMVEAVSPRVTVNPFSSKAAERCVRVRRMPRISRERIYNTCVEALRRIGKPYDTAKIVELSKIYLKNSTIEPDLIKEAYICSDLVHRAFLFGGDAVVVNVRGDRTPTPADLSASTYIDDVSLGWRPI